MKRFLKISGLSLVAVIVLLGTWIFFFPEKTLAYIVPQVRQVNDVHIDVKDDVANVYSKLVVRNKSFLTLSIDSIKYSIVISDKITFKNNKYVGLKLAAYDEDTFDFPITKIPYKNIFRNFRSELKKGDSTKYELNLKLQYSTFFGSIELPIEKQANFKIPRAPELKVIDIKYSKIRLKQMNADVKVKIINHGDFTVSISNIKYSLFVNDQGHATGRYPSKVDLDPNSFALLNLPVNISIKQLGKTLLDVLKDNDNYRYSLVVDANVESPDAQEQPCHVSLVKKGMMELKK